jgi:transcriptional regulator with XRE-family HTH domain
VDNRSEVREFLTSRRGKVTPQQAGLPETLHRRVPGLRRSEVAALAGMSVEYYAKLERGSLGGVSASVLDAITRALQLDEAERAHLFHLAQAADGTSAAMRPRRSRNHWTVRPSLQWTLDAITTGPAIVGNNRSDLLATNLLGCALYADLYNDPNGAPNFARFAFLDSAAHRFYPDWDLAADITVANLRTAAGQDPHNKSLHDLVGGCPPEATSSAAVGAPTTSAPMAPASNTSSTTSSATSPLPTKASTSEQNPASP